MSENRTKPVLPSASGLRLAIAVGGITSLAAHAVAWGIAGRPPGVIWLNMPVVVVLGVAVWLSYRPRVGPELAVGWTVGSGIAATLGLAVRTGSSSSPVLPILLLLVVFAFRFFERRQAVWALGISIVGMVGLTLLDAVGLGIEPQYTHTAVESGLILGVVLLLSGILLVLDWDERAAAVDELREASLRLTAVNNDLRTTRAEALDRARQQHALARLTMAAFEEAAGQQGRRADVSARRFEAMLVRCCTVIAEELEHVCVQLHQTTADGLSPRGVDVTALPPGVSEPVPYRRWHDWQVVVNGREWGILRVTCRDHLSMDERVFVEGGLGVISAVVERHSTIGELRRTESQLVQAQRLEGVAFMASGVVHDLNNALTCIIGNTQLALESISTGSGALEELEDVERAALNAREVCRQLLDTARRQHDEQEVCSLPAVVNDLMRTLRRTVGDNIWVDCDVADFSGGVPLSAGKAEQVLLNLLVNARDAMPDGGHLLVTLGPLPKERPTDPDQLELCVQDTGVGIPKSLQRRIFEPLFTTKKDSGGTGLGLATVATIVRSAGGEVQLDSSAGQGSTFRVVLPLLELSEDTAASGPPVSGQGAPVREGRPRILLVEDDPQVRSSVTRSLRRYGYEVFEAAAPDQALALFQHHGESIDLLLTDYSMPQMDGLELGRRFRQRMQDLPMLLVTGWADSARLQRSVVHDKDRLLEKPFTSEELRDMVAELLADSRADASVLRTG